jgi:hypothetical protein
VYPCIEPSPTNFAGGVKSRSRTDDFDLREWRHVERLQLKGARGGLQKQTGGLPGVRVLADFPARRVRRLCGDAKPLEGQGVHDRHVRRNMHREDRAGRRDAVEILAREVSLLLEHGVVVAKADQPTNSGLVGVGLLERIQRLRNCFHGADRRTIQVSCNRHEPGAREMAVRLDEPGHDGPPLEVEHEIGLWQPSLHIVVAANRDDSVVLDHERGRLRAFRVHREDSPVGPDLKPGR